MNIFAKHLAVLPAAALAFVLPVAAPTMAGEKSDAIVVTSKAAMKEWQVATTKKINRSLARAPIPNNSRPNNSIVQIRFNISADGKPENVELLQGNGNWAARSSARYAVRRLSGLDQVPVNNPQNAQFLANIIFASGLDSHEELKAKLKKSEAARIAASPGDTTILLGG